MPSACCQEYRARLMLGLSAAMAGSFQRVTVHRYMFARVAAFSFRLPLLAPARGTPAVSAAPRPPATQATALLRGYCTAHAGRQPVVAPCSSRYQGGAHVAVWALPGLPRPAAARTLRCPHMQVMRTRGRPRGAPRPPCNVRGGFGRGGGGGGGPPGQGGDDGHAAHSEGYLQERPDPRAPTRSGPGHKTQTDFNHAHSKEDLQKRPALRAQSKWAPGTA